MPTDQSEPEAPKSFCDFYNVTDAPTPLGFAYRGNVTDRGGKSFTARVEEFYKTGIRDMERSMDYTACQELQGLLAQLHRASPGGADMTQRQKVIWKGRTLAEILTILEICSQMTRGETIRVNGIGTWRPKPVGHQGTRDWMSLELAKYVDSLEPGDRSAGGESTT